MPQPGDRLVRTMHGLQGAPSALVYAVRGRVLHRLAGQGGADEIDRLLAGWVQGWQPDRPLPPLPAGVHVAGVVRDGHLIGLLVARWACPPAPAQALVALEDMAQLWADVHWRRRDALTGLAGREVLLDHLELACRAARRGQGTPVLLFLDVDNLKWVNDQHGHQAGDLILTDMARRLLSAARPEDTVARHGGDEFVVLCPSVADPAEAVAIAARLHAVLAESHLVGSVPVPAAASIGVAIGPFADAAEGLRQADAAMYKAKQRGTGYAVYDEELDRGIRWRLSVRAHFAAAIRTGQLRLHYQPEYRMSSGRIVTIEALVRWHHPERGLLYPEEFLDAASAGRASDQLCPWALLTACEEAATWPKKWPRLPPPVLAVNVSPHDLTDGHLPQLVADALTATGLPGRCLQLEVTEGALLADLTDAARQLHDIRALGASVALDDFGTGFSALTLLRDLPVQALKIDRSFTAGLSDGPRNAAIVAAVVRLGHQLGARVCGEGVETREQLRCLRLLGCDDVQGFLLHRPVPASDLPDRLYGLPA